MNVPLQYLNLYTLTPSVTIPLGFTNTFPTSNISDFKKLEMCWGKSTEKKKKKSAEQRQTPFGLLFFTFQKLGDYLPLCSTTICFLLCCTTGHIASIYSPLLFFPLLLVMPICFYSSIFCMTKKSPYMGTSCTGTGAVTLVHLGMPLVNHATGAGLTDSGIQQHKV